MKKIQCISTGGTFNKIYNPLNGQLEIDNESLALRELGRKWLYQFDISNIIGKDSLDINRQDRLKLLETITLSGCLNIIVVHGTDTMRVTAEFLDQYNLDKQIILTGSMVPYAIDPVEATANFSAAYGYIQASEKKGIFISMNGIVAPYREIIKERSAGKFISSRNNIV